LTKFLIRYFIELKKQDLTKIPCWTNLGFWKEKNRKNSIKIVSSFSQYLFRILLYFIFINFKWIFLDFSRILRGTIQEQIIQIWRKKYKSDQDLSKKTQGSDSDLCRFMFKLCSKYDFQDHTKIYNWFCLGSS
jgi:hypothetical protein